MLISPPRVLKEQTSGTEVTLEWPPWSRARGDTGDGPVAWYSVFMRGHNDNEYRYDAFLWSSSDSLDMCSNQETFIVQYIHVV